MALTDKCNKTKRAHCEEKMWPEKASENNLWCFPISGSLVWNQSSSRQLAGTNQLRLAWTSSITDKAPLFYTHVLGDFNEQCLPVCLTHHSNWWLLHLFSLTDLIWLRGTNELVFRSWVGFRLSFSVPVSKLFTDLKHSDSEITVMHTDKMLNAGIDPRVLIYS